MIMELLLDILGYTFIGVALLGLFYILVKILAMGFSSMRQDDGND